MYQICDYYILSNARTLIYKQFQVDFEILKVTFYQER